MNSQLTILPHITVLSYLRLEENLCLRLLNHSENEFFMNKFDYFKNVKQSLKVSYDPSSKNLQDLKRFQLNKYLEQVNVINIESDENLLFLLEILEFLLDIYNANNTNWLINQNLIENKNENIQEDYKNDAEVCQQKDGNHQQHKDFKIKLSFKDLNKDQKQQIKNSKLEEQINLQIFNYLKKYNSNQQQVRFQFIIDLTQSSTMFQSSCNADYLSQIIKKTRSKLVIDEKSNVVITKSMLNLVKELEINKSSEQIHYQKYCNWNFKHIQKMSLFYCKYYPFPPAYENLKALIIESLVDAFYIQSIENQVKNYFKNSLTRTQQILGNYFPSFVSLQKFKGTFYIVRNLDSIKTQQALRFISHILESIKNASKVILKIFIKKYQSSKKLIENCLQSYCKNIEFIDNLSEIDFSQIIQLQNSEINSSEMSQSYRKSRKYFEIIDDATNQSEVNVFIVYQKNLELEQDQIKVYMKKIMNLKVKRQHQNIQMF